MGVISNNRTALPTVTFRDDFFPAEYLIDSPDSTDVEDDDGHQHQNRDGNDDRFVVMFPRRRRAKYGQLKVPHVKQYGFSAKSRLGARKMRRVENNKLLMSMTDVEDICEDLSDLLPDTTTAFSQLFVENDKMKIWNEFIHKSEEEQRKILKNGFKKFRASESMSDGSGDKKKSNEASTSKNTAGFDGRMGNPAFYSTNHRYRKVDKNLRFLLSHKESSWEKLRDTETDLTEFFLQDPRGTWTGCLESSFDRLLLHAVTQFLFLRACSFDSGGGQRKTKVTNKYKRFVVPQECLFSYLRKIACHTSSS